MTPAFVFVLMVLTSYRVWRIVGADDWPPSRALRDWIGRRVKFTTEEQVGPLTVPHTAYPIGFWHELRTLIECPWCLGSWVSFAVVAIVAQFVVVPLPVLEAGAVACAVGLIGTALDA